MGISYHALSCCYLMTLVFVLTVVQVAHGQGRCRDSSRCRRNGDGFCNFDHGNSGFCESCSDIGGSCEDAGFITQRGEQECKNICGGNSGSSGSCSDSLDCQRNCPDCPDCGNCPGFCNFDNIRDGFCELCSDIDGRCENAGFVSQKGEKECKKICEGDGPGCSDNWRERKCRRKRDQGKCNRNRVKRNCMNTCGFCTGTTNNPNPPSNPPTTPPSVTTNNPNTPPNPPTTPPAVTTNNPNTPPNPPTIPPSGTTLTPNTCTSQIRFPVTNSGISGYPHKMTVYGIPMFATSKWSTDKLNHVASVLAELLDNDEDGCVDDPAVLNKLLEAQDGYRAAVLLPNNENDAESAATKLEAAGFFIGTVEGEDETNLECTGLDFTHTCSDASIEELFHLITGLGHANVYTSIFGAGWGSNSKLTQAMDVARGGRFQNIPNPYPSSAWYTYNDSTCDYNCQAIEYIWWGYCSYSRVCEGRSGDSGFESEFKYLRKSQLLTGDLKMSKLFQESGTGYVLPLKHVDGKYHGCKTCPNGPNHGGN